MVVRKLSTDRPAHPIKDRHSGPVRTKAMIALGTKKTKRGEEIGVGDMGSFGEGYDYQSGKHNVELRRLLIVL